MIIHPFGTTHEDGEIGTLGSINQGVYPRFETTNMWAEPLPAEFGAPFILRQTPGLRLVGTSQDLTSNLLTGGDIIPSLGIFSQDGVFDGDILVVVSSAHSSNDVGGVYRGTGSSLSDGVSIGDWTHSVAPEGADLDAEQFARGAFIRGMFSYTFGGRAYVFDGSNVAEVAGLPPVIRDVTSLGNRFVWLDYYTDQIYYSDLGSGTWTGTNFFTAESLSDRAVACLAFSGNLYLAGTETTEIWSVSGDPDLPFSFTGVTMPVGCASSGTLVSVGNFCAMVGNGSDGFGVFQINGGSYEKISPPWLDRIIQSVPIGAKNFLFATSFQFDSHVCYELHIPHLQKSYVYDVTTGFWGRITNPTHGNGLGYAGRQWAYYDTESKWFCVTAGKWQDYISSGGVLPEQNAQIGVLEPDVFTYFNSPIERKWGAYQPTKTRIEVKELAQQIRMTDPNGVNVNGSFYVSMSNDLGQTWYGSKNIAVHAGTRYGQRAVARRLGQFHTPGRLYQFSTTEAAHIEVGPISIDEKIL